MPALTPVTVPVLPTVATLVLPLVHRPPPEPSVSRVGEPMQVCMVPAIAGGAELTVTTSVDLQPDVSA